MGRLQLVREQSPACEPAHTFDRTSRVARADPKLSHRAYRVLAAIEGHCWGDRRDCWTSNTTLGLEAGGIGPEGVRRAIRELEKLGYLRIEPDPSKVRGHRLILLYELKGALPGS